MKRQEKGVTLIALAITIIVLLIIAGISLGQLTDEKGIINQADETTSQAQRESILEKIEAELYKEKTKKGRAVTKAELIHMLESNYGTISGENGSETLTTTVGGYQIPLKEIIGWTE